MTDGDAPPDDPGGWYADVAAAVRAKPPDDVARELAGLVDLIADEPGGDAAVDHYVVGVSFTKDHAGLDYAVDAVRATGPETDPVVETVKPPASENHRYVSFAHPPDPHFDAAALRARLLSTVDRARREAAGADRPADGFAGLWEEL